MAAAALTVLDAVTRSRALDGLLGVEPHDVHAADADAAALSLVVHLSQLKRDGQFLARVHRALDALAALARASRSLRGYPLAKRAFWKRALDHPTCRSLLVHARALAHTHVLRYEDPEFPRLVLDCSRGAFAAELARAIADWQCAGGASSDWLDGRQAADQPLDALVLANVMARASSPRAMTAFRVLIRVIAGLAAGCSGGARCLSLARNSLTIDHFAAICSAVQDPASSIEDLCLARTISIQSPNDRFYCWWWLAMGLSRPIDHPGGTARLGRVDLSGNPMFPRDIEVWNATLQSPLAVLSHESVELPPSRLYSLPAHGCRVFSSHIANFESAEPIADVADMFAGLPSGSTVSIEAMGVDNNGWVCLLIPGYGLAWTPPSPSFSAQQQMAEDSNNQRRPIVRELDISDLTAVETTIYSMCAFIESVGGSLVSLSIKRAIGTNVHDLEAILSRCPRLERLDLEGTRFPSWEPLIVALEGPLGQTLRSLNLRNNRFGYVLAGRLASALLETASPPALEELRLGQTHIGIPGAQSMEGVLRSNKRLQILEMPMPNLQASDEEYAELCGSFEHSYQGELLATTPMPTRCKLAFLSVLQHARDSTASLDVGVLRAIFELAAVEKRRSLVWWRRS